MRQVKKYIINIALNVLLITPVYAGPVEYLYQRHEQQKAAIAAPKTIKEELFRQNIDHQNPSKGTFNQRYFIDESFGSKANSPVFFYICGEWTCSPQDLNGAIRAHAKKHHARLIALEHRYYGKSLPGKTLSTADLKYLTTDNALNDLAHFQKTISAKNKWKGTWIAFGGSYPGSLSAYYRLKYPELVAGAIASSAPVMAKEDFFEYDAHIDAVTGQECAERMRQVTKEIEDAYYQNPKRFAEIKALFLAQEVKHPIDFMYLVADIGAGAIQYGRKEPFCKLLAQSPLEGYATMARQTYDALGVSAVEMTAQGIMSESPDDYKKSGAGMRQWYYQSCTEYGYWQNANPDASHATRSSLINLDYHHEICKRVFGLTDYAQTQSINEALYWPLMNDSTSKIHFTNGSQDPWSRLSIAERNGNAVNPKLNYTLIENKAHCDDLRAPKSTDSDALIAARKTTDDLITRWLGAK